MSRADKGGVIILLLSALLILSACGGGGTETPPVTSADTDGDGLSDQDETSLHFTSPTLVDTDGDGYSDYREIKELGYDASVNNYKYNPLIADLPKLEIDIQEVPTIGYVFTDTDSQSQNIATTRFQSQTVSQSVSVGASVTIGVESETSTTVGASATGPSAEASQSLKVSASSTVSFDSTTTTQNQTAWEDMQSNGVENSTTTNGGYARIGVVLKNAGHIPFTIQHFSLSSFKASDNDPFAILATLKNPAFQPTSLYTEGSAVGPDKTGLLNFEHNSLDLGTVRTMLNEARSITIEPATFEITDNSGQAFAYTDAEVESRTAKVLIDYGPHAKIELYQVATNTDPNSPGQLLSTLLNDYLKVPYIEVSGAVETIRGIGARPGRWVINSVRDKGTDIEQTLYDADKVAYDIKAINVKAGDDISLVYLEDPDGDGIGYREELIHGTDPGNDDTDGDGISDFEEIRDDWTINAINAIDSNRYPSDVYSSPVHADYDGDGLSDADEKAKGLDPYNADTDGDGTPDNLDTIIDGATPLADNLYVELVKPLTVKINGKLVAIAPQVVASVSIDWGDGSPAETYATASGGNSTLTIPPVEHVYATAGTYTITLDAADDTSPSANTLNKTAVLVITESMRIDDVLNFDSGWQIDKHIREVVDINDDGYADIVGIYNSDVVVISGSASGFGTNHDVWSDDWGAYDGYASVATDPRWLVDLDGDGDLDIVGVKASSSEVHYSLNNGSGFDPSVLWISGIAWDGNRDSAYVVDIDNNGFPDFVHAGFNNKLNVYLTLSGSLNHSAALSDGAAWPTGDPDRRKYPIEAADLDGDGCTDLVLFGNVATYHNRSLCDGSFVGWTAFSIIYDYDSGWKIDQHKRFVDDVTHDGLPDIVGFSNSTVSVMRNTSTSGNISFDAGSTWSMEWVTNKGWVDNKTADTWPWLKVQWEGLYPRYLADINNDGYKDIVGFSSTGARVGINGLGINGVSEFKAENRWSYAFDNRTSDWWRENYFTGYRKYFPRTVSDINNDGRADFIGFERTGVVYQFAPEVGQFQ